MIRMSWARAASVEETLALWAASLREIKQRIRPLFTQERVAASAGVFLGRSAWGRAAQDRLDARGGGWRSWPMAAAGNSGSWGLGRRCPARYRARLCHRAFGG